MSNKKIAYIRTLYQLFERIKKLNHQLIEGIYKLNSISFSSNSINKGGINREKFVGKVQCTVCHEYISSVTEDKISCPFCERPYHYSCAESWLLSHNICPTCMNEYINPK